MKRLLSTIVLAMGITAAMAQDSSSVKQLHKRDRSARHGVKEQGRDRMQHAYKGFKDLNLTAEQKDQFAKLRKEHHEKMMAVLTPEQKTILQKQKDEAKAKHAAHNAERFDRIKEKLQLSDEQASKMKSTNDAFRKEASVIRANKALAAADQRQQLKTLAAAHRNEINAMLTPAQQDTLKQLKNRHPKRTVR